MNSADAGEVARRLRETNAALERARRLVREAARQMIPFAGIPTERHILYLFNDAIPSHDATQAYLAEVMASRKVKTQPDRP